MGTIVCKECEQIIAPVQSEKSEVLFGVCENCSSHSHEEK